MTRSMAVIAMAALLCFSCALHAAQAQDVEATRRFLGIDLGTHYARMAVHNGNDTEIIPGAMGQHATPACVAFTETGHLIGAAARDHALVDHKRTICGIKRFLGRRFDDAAVQRDIQRVSYDVVECEGRPCVSVDVNGEVKLFTPEDITAMLLVGLKAHAEASLGHALNETILMPRPANPSDDAAFQVQLLPGNETSRGILQALSAAADLANMTDPQVFIRNWAHCAVFAYGFNATTDDGSTLLVAHVGARATDVTVLVVEYGVFDIVTATTDYSVGADDFDAPLVEYFVELIAAQHQVNVSDDASSMMKLRDAAESAKVALSHQDQVDIQIQNIIAGVDFVTTLTRARFEQLTQDVFTRLEEHLRKTLAQAHVDAGDTDILTTPNMHLMLVGAAGRIPKVRAVVSDVFGGLEIEGGVAPEEALAVGAAVLNYKINTDEKEIYIDNILLLTVGVETRGGVATPVMHRSSWVPMQKTRRFTTCHDNQTTVTIRVFQGQRALIKDSFALLGELTLTGIRPAPRGVPQIEVTMAHGHVDDLVNVSVHEVDAGSPAVSAIWSDTVLWNAVEDHLRLADEQAQQDESDLAELVRQNLVHMQSAAGPWDDQDTSVCLLASDEGVGWHAPYQHADYETFTAELSTSSDEFSDEHNEL